MTEAEKTDRIKMLELITSNINPEEINFQNLDFTEEELNRQGFSIDSAFCVLKKFQDEGILDYFYAEFVAARAVEGDYEHYFGTLSFDAPFRGDEVRLDQALAGKVAASCANVSTEELAVLNPAVDSAVFVGRGNIPRGYLLRVPSGAAGQFAQRLAQVAADARALPEQRVRSTRSARRSGASRAGREPTRTASADASIRTHRVGKGQTLSHIAKQYRVSVQRLKGFNSLRSSAVKPGQVLRIPAG